MQGRVLFLDPRSERPVQAIVLIGDMLADGGASADPPVRTMLRENARRLRESLDALAWLLESPDAGDAQPIAVAPALDAVATALRAYRGRVRLDPTDRGIAGLPAVRATMDGLVQIVLNLALNALEAQHRQVGGRLRIRGTLSDDATAVHLMVEDDGPGLSAPVRLALAEGSVVPGSPAGSGLAVVRALVRQWGGSLVVGPPSSHGGACIGVSLPVWRAPA